MIEKILERLEEVEEECMSEPTDDYFFGKFKGIVKAKEIVQEVAKDGGWIPCSERLPEPHQRVLVFDALDGSITIEQLEEDESFIPPAVAWMPLPPAPYQKGE